MLRQSVPCSAVPFSALHFAIGSAQPTEHRTAAALRCASALTCRCLRSLQPLEECRLQRELALHAAPALRVAYSSDAHRVATAAADNSVGVMPSALRSVPCEHLRAARFPLT